MSPVQMPTIISSPTMTEMLSLPPTKLRSKSLTPRKVTKLGYSGSFPLRERLIKMTILPLPPKLRGKPHLISPPRLLRTNLEKFHRKNRYLRSRPRFRGWIVDVGDVVL